MHINNSSPKLNSGTNSYESIHQKSKKPSKKLFRNPRFKFDKLPIVEKDVTENPRNRVS